MYGNNLVQRYERYAWIPLAVVFAIITISAAPHLHRNTHSRDQNGMVCELGLLRRRHRGLRHRVELVCQRLQRLHVRKSVPARSIFWWTFIGEFAACVLLQVLGVLLTTWHNTAIGTDVLSLAVKPMGSFWADLFLLILVLSVIANNIPNDYSLGLTVQVLGKSGRRSSVGSGRWSGRPIYTAIGLYVVAVRGFTVFESLTFFLLIISYWLGPFSIILGLEHFVFRRGGTTCRVGTTAAGWRVGSHRGLIAFVLGIIGAAPGRKSGRTRLLPHRTGGEMVWG